MSVPDGAYRTVERCRICGSARLDPVVSLGATPLANAFLAAERAREPEPRFPLDALRCARCYLVQLGVVVRPELMFSDYAYSSSASAPAVRHFDELASEVVERFDLAGRRVVEVGSNDGVLLASLAARGARVLGVDPAARQAAIANARGLETIVGYFDRATASRVVAEKGRARLVVANNVLAHIDDLHEVLAALDALLEDDGVFVAEVPYVADLLDRVEYDTIYHEHLSYFALTPLRTLFSRAGMELFDVRRLLVHGGSIRIYVGRSGRRPVSDAVPRTLEEERASGLLDASAYDRFAARVWASRRALLDLLRRSRREGHTIAALGATAKGNTLLNYCGIGPDLVSFIADSTPLKQGRVTPGMHIPVRSEEAIAAERPDLTLLLAWNYADEIIGRFADYVSGGGRFIHPVPIARILP
ncbi:MAG: class I SAM-dependent methyltransferase [Elusimicrobia bacterium]|nr:class I SAM-dependent methyltransferase [Elusimicrobiota bacterium]